MIRRRLGFRIEIGNGTLSKSRFRIRRMFQCQIFEYYRVVDGIRIPLETIRIKIRWCPKRAFDSFPYKLTTIEDTATDEANPDLIRGNVTVNLLDPVLELGKRPLPWVCPKYGFIRHGRFRNGLWRKCLCEES